MSSWAVEYIALVHTSLIYENILIQLFTLRMSEVVALGYSHGIRTTFTPMPIYMQARRKQQECGVANYRNFYSLASYFHISMHALIAINVALD